MFRDPSYITMYAAVFVIRSMGENEEVYTVINVQAGSTLLPLSFPFHLGFPFQVKMAVYVCMCVFM